MSWLMSMWSKLFGKANKPKVVRESFHPRCDRCDPAVRAICTHKVHKLEPREKA